MSLGEPHSDGGCYKLIGVPREDLFRSREELLAEALARQEREVAYVDETQTAIILREDSP